MNARSQTRAGTRPPRKILFVIEKLTARSGGAERVLIETANALAARGHMVEIASHEFRHGTPFYPLAPGVIAVNLRPPRRGLRRIVGRARDLWHKVMPDLPPFDLLTWVSRNGGFWRRLQAYIRATEPDVTIAFMPPATTALALAEPGHKMRRVTSTHNAPVQDFHNPVRWDPSRLDRRRRLRLMGKMDRIAVLLPEYRDFYSAALQARALVLPNAVPQIAPEVLAASPRRKTVMAVGRLATVKRHDLLIEAWAKIAPDFPDWDLRIYGEGPLKADLAARIAQYGLTNAHLMGHQTNVAECYLEASILAHPAEFEGFPLAVTEALASGLPVVGFEDCSGLNRLVKDGETGILVAADGDRLAQYSAALAGLMRDPTRIRQMGAAGPASMAAYAPDAVIDLWEEMLFDADVPRGGLAG
ncbi:glycosyltransferase [Gemmobacter serpentinus]|uniref:glycosyltransferase n=1 Tax=Gemmobacter serpentinus TaxID=2652247 RepID=UPI00124CA1F6|nr:glycosyltransferase [Gemmobacter serpentinus]